MKSSPKQPWTKFLPHSDNWGKFVDVAHVTHVANAVAVLETRAIKSRLVYDDESKLRKRRIEVVWLSPNRWNQGYRYGQIAFNFEWKSLLKGRHFYWVEAMDYKPVACRFLITDVDRPSLDAYDPETDEGPWRHDARTGEHSFNRNLTMEFMFEGEIAMHDCLNTTLVDHHPGMCCLGRHRCTDMQVSRHKSGALLLASAIGRNLDVEQLKMTRERKGKTVRSADLWDAADELMVMFDKIEVKKSGRIIFGEHRATAVARAVLQALANGKSREARLLAELFTSIDELKQATELLLQESFDLKQVAEL